MITDRTRELIHAELDGELDAPGRQELDAELSRSEEARDYQAQMRELNAFLDRVPEPAMPERLHDAILGAISLPAPRRRRSLGFTQFPGFIRYGFAAAAGLLLAVGIYEYRPGLDGPGDMGGMAGTIMPGQQAPGIVLATDAFELEQLSSEVSLVSRAGTLVLDMRLESGAPVEVILDFAGEGLQFDAITQMESELDSIEVADRTVQISAVGRQRFAVMLHHEPVQDGDGDARIQVSWSRDGEVLRTSDLKVK